MEKIEKTQGSLPLMPLRGLTAFPNTTVFIDVGRERSLGALEHAMDEDRRLFLVSQRNVNCDQPEQADLYTVGTVARVRHVMPASEEIVRLVCEGEARALLLSIEDKPRYSEATYVEMESDLSGDSIELIGYAERAKTLFSALSRERGHVSGELVQIVESETEADTLADIIAANALRKVDDKQKLLECRSVLMRLQLLCGMLREEIELSRIEHEIEEKVKDRIENTSQYLRKKLS